MLRPRNCLNKTLLVNLALAFLQTFEMYDCMKMAPVSEQTSWLRQKKEAIKSLQVLCGWLSHDLAVFKADKHAANPAANVSSLP